MADWRVEAAFDTLGTAWWLDRATLTAQYTELHDELVRSAASSPPAAAQLRNVVEAWTVVQDLWQQDDAQMAKLGHCPDPDAIVIVDPCGVQEIDTYFSMLERIYQRTVISGLSGGSRREECGFVGWAHQVAEDTLMTDTHPGPHSALGLSYRQLLVNVLRCRSTSRIWRAAYGAHWLWRSTLPPISGPGLV